MHLTIAIATWNRADRLSLTLDALRDVTLPDGVTCEAVVCDNNSTDHTRTMIEKQITQWREQHDNRFPLRYLFESTQGKSHALNRLIRETQDDWMLFIDDDIKVEPDWLNAYAQGITRYPDAVCLGGPMSPWLDEPLPDKGRKAFLLEQYPEAFGILNVAQDTRMVAPHVTAYGGNMALRRDAIPETGYDLDAGMIGGKRIAGEDVEMVRKVIEGREGWLLADAKVGHYVTKDQLNLGTFWRWQKGMGARWQISDGKPKPGKFGVAWWAWRRYLARLSSAVIRWRPWPTQSFYHALSEAARFYGYLKA